MKIQTVKRNFIPSLKKIKINIVKNYLPSLQKIELYNV